MSSHSADGSTGAQNSQEETAKDDLSHAEKGHSEQQHEDKDTNQDDEHGQNDSVDFINHLAFKKARTAIRLFVRRSEELYQESQDQHFMQTYSAVEHDLYTVDDMHKKTLAIVRKAIEVDKKEGDKLKADLREKWMAQRCPFANRLYPYEYDESDPDLNPESDLEGEYLDE